MHPDFCLALQKCASNLGLIKHKQPYLNSQRTTSTATRMSCSMAELEFQSPKKSNENGNDDDDDIAEDLVRIVSDDEGDEGGDGGEASEAPQKHHQLDLDENASMCSELSVGQEHALHHEIPPADAQEDEEILDVSDTHSNSSVDENNRTPSTPGETMSSLSPFTLASTLRFPVPFSLQAPTANVMTPGAPNANISPFQEEFLRKSHLYAEELMKHQMHLMAAARASAFSLRNQNLHPGIGGHPSHLVHINPLTKLGQISAAAAAAAALSAAAVQNSKTQGHGQQSPIISPHNAASHVLPPQQHHPHSHPHAHLQHHLPQSASTTSDTLAKLTALSKQTSPATSHMMSTLNQLQTQMQAHLPRLFNDNNDNLHERALKFSIDNILKGDFGRGQSPPPTATSHSKKSLHFLSHANKQFSNLAKQKSNCSSSSSSAVSDTLDPQQHQHQQQQHHQHQSSANSTPAFSASLASICTNSNDSNSTAVSSSYSSANGTGDLIKSSPSQTPTLSPGLNETAGSGRAGGGGAVGKDDTGSATTAGAGTSGSSSGGTSGGNGGPIVWPAWVYCTRYSDRPSSGRSPRVRKPKKATGPNDKANSPTGTSSSTSAGSGGSASAAAASAASSSSSSEDKRPRTAFSGSQLARLKHEFNENRYLTEKRRQQLSSELGLNEAQIKIWFQNKRAKLKKSSGVKNPLALQLMAQGLYNHSTIPLTREEEELQELQEREKSANNNNLTQPTASAVSS